METYNENFETIIELCENGYQLPSQYGTNAIYRLVANVPIDIYQPDGKVHQVSSTLKDYISKLSVKPYTISISDDYYEIAWRPLKFPFVIYKVHYSKLLLEFADFLDREFPVYSTVQLQIDSHDDIPLIVPLEEMYRVPAFTPEFFGNDYGVYVTPNMPSE